MKHTLAFVIDARQTGKKLLVFGNGGSASEAQHAAGRFVGWSSNERRAFRQSR